LLQVQNLQIVSFNVSLKVAYKAILIDLEKSARAENRSNGISAESGLFGSW
jgi:hypothetical protein